MQQYSAVSTIDMPFLAAKGSVSKPWSSDGRMLMPAGITSLTILNDLPLRLREFYMNAHLWRRNALGSDQKRPEDRPLKPA